MAPDLSPQLSELDDLLRQCVECGLCLPHCATYQVTGNEVHSPRGRLMLLGEMIQGSGAGVPDTFLDAFDHCIGCRACETACPGGVPFSLLEYGQGQSDARPISKVQEPLLIRAILPRLDQRGVLRLVSVGTSFARAVFGLVLGKQWRQKLEGGWLSGAARLVSSTPSSPDTDDRLWRLLSSLARNSQPVQPMVPSQTRQRILLFQGCANEGLLGPSSERLRALLAWAGFIVEKAPGQECCGALASHTGRPGRASTLRRRNVAALDLLLAGETTLLVEAAGCGVELKKRYPEAVTTRTSDVAVFLASNLLPIRRSLPLKVVYHDPCHARHGQGIVDEPRDLLRSIPGLTLVEPSEPEVCCGSGGAWGLRHSELSQEIGRRKARDLAATGADLVVTSNPGCLGQIADALALEAPELPIIPLTDLLWFVCRPGR